MSANIGAVLIIVTSMTKISLIRNEGDCPPFPCVRYPRNGMKQEPANSSAYSSERVHFIWFFLRAQHGAFSHATTKE